MDSWGFVACAASSVVLGLSLRCLHLSSYSSWWFYLSIVLSPVLFLALLRLSRTRRRGTRANARLVVIGAGVSGLSAGIYASRNGYSVTVLEQHSEPGGMCSCWRRHGFLVDGCLHWSPAGPSMIHQYSRVGIALGDLVTLKNFATFIDQETGRTLVVGRDLERLERDMIALSTHPQNDAPVIRDFVRGCRVFRDNPSELPGKPLGLMRPSELAGYAWRNWRVMWVMATRGTISCAEYGKRLRDEFLRHVVTTIFSEDSPVAFDMVVVGSVAASAMVRPARGSASIPLDMAKRLEECGGRLLTGCPATRIVRDETSGRVVGVETPKGFFEADHVVAACDVRVLMDRLLGGVKDPSVERFMSSHKILTRMCLVTYLMGRDPTPKVSSSSEDPPEGYNVRLSRPFEAAGRLQTMGMVRTMTHDLWPHHVPLGRCAHQAIVWTTYDHWHDLLVNRGRAAYDSAKRELSDLVFDRCVAPFVPGGANRDDLLHADVATPKTFERYTSSHQGSFEGFEHELSPDCLVRSLPRVPSVPGLWLAGQWANPGGGVIRGIISGRHAVQRICLHDLAPFTDPDDR